MSISPAVVSMITRPFVGRAISWYLEEVSCNPVRPGSPSLARAQTNNLNFVNHDIGLCLPMFAFSSKCFSSCYKLAVNQDTPLKRGSLRCCMQNNQYPGSATFCILKHICENMCPHIYPARRYTHLPLVRSFKRSLMVVDQPNVPQHASVPLVSYILAD